MRGSTAAGINISLLPLDCSCGEFACSAVWGRDLFPLAFVGNLPVELYWKRPLFGVCWISGSAIQEEASFPWHLWGICRWCYTGRVFFPLVFVGFPVALYEKRPFLWHLWGFADGAVWGRGLSPGIWRFWHSAHSVPERGFCGTEYALGAQNSLLWYATHFLM